MSYMRNLREKVADALDLNKEIILDMPKITFIGSLEVTVENYKGIIEYTDLVIRISTPSHILRLTGKCLEIKTITQADYPFMTLAENGSIIGQTIMCVV